MLNNALLDLFADSLKYIQAAVADIPDDRMAEQPAGMLNHPIWTLTHLCVAHDFTLQCLGRPTICPPEWTPIAVPGSQPQPDRATYPPAQQTLEMLARQHELITEAVRAAGPEQFEQPSPEELRGFAPTLGHVVAYMLASHENYHLAQIQVWRRLSGIAS